jgi:uncharacterized membrane protein
VSFFAFFENLDKVRRPLWIGPFLDQILNSHPVFVHFPIALFPTAFLFYGIGLFRKRNDLLLAGQICLALGLAGTVISVLTGYFAQETIPHGEVIHRMMGTHQTLGFAILGLGALLMIWSFLKRERIPKAPKLFLAVLGFAVLLILQNGDLGARMVFVEGAAVKAVSSPAAAPSPEAKQPLQQPKESHPETEKGTHDHHGHDHHH